MKNKIVGLISLLVCSLTILSGCKEKVHQHVLDENYKNTDSYHYKECIDCHEIVETQKHELHEDGNYLICDICGYKLLNVIEETQEELFLKWKVGRDYLANYTGEKTIKTNISNSLDNVLYSKTEIEYGQKNNEFYNTNEVYEINENNEFVKNTSTIEVVKKVIVDNKEKNKHYFESKYGDYVNVEASYVSPDFISRKEEELDSIDLEYFYVDKGDTYTSFIESINSYCQDDFEADASEICFTKNGDGSIALSIINNYEFVDSYFNEEDYQKTKESNEYIISVKDGKIVSINSKAKIYYIFDSKTNVEEIKQSYLIGYKFDSQKFNSFSIDTDITKNNYYGFVYFVVEGYGLRYSDEAYVDEKYTATQAISFLCNINSFIISSLDTSFENCFKVYLDEDYKTEFTEIDVKNDDPITLYVKFELPENLTAAVCVFKNEHKSWIYLAYIYEKGYTFRAESIYSGYKILSIDGNEWKEGDSTDVVCSENKAYVIVFDTPNLVG